MSAQVIRVNWMLFGVYFRENVSLPPALLQAVVVSVDRIDSQVSAVEILSVLQSAGSAQEGSGLEETRW